MTLEVFVPSRRHPAAPPIPWLCTGSLFRAGFVLCVQHTVPLLSPPCPCATHTRPPAQPVSLGTLGVFPPLPACPDSSSFPPCLLWEEQSLCPISHCVGWTDILQVSVRCPCPCLHLATEDSPCGESLRKPRKSPGLW